MDSNEGVPLATTMCASSNKHADEDVTNYGEHSEITIGRSSDDDDDSARDTEDSILLEHVNSYKELLYSIVEDLTERLMEGDHNLISGVGKFIKQYKQMMKSHAPNSTLSFALHNFGKSDSEFFLHA